MDQLKPATLIAELLPARSWVQRHLPIILLVGAAIAVLALMMFIHESGLAGQLRRDHPALLSKRQTRQLQDQARVLAQQQARSQQRADSTYARTAAPEQDAARRQVLIHHLTTRYHAITPDTTRAAAAAAADYLRHYAPGAGADSL